MIADENGALVIENSNCFAGRDGNTPRWIILHSTAGGSSAQGIAEYFQGTTGTSNPVSANYVVGQDGTIVQCNSEADGAWANGYITANNWWASSGINPNNVTISIEHVKSTTDNSADLTLEQKNASFKLIQHICMRHAIPTREADENGGVTGHYSIDPVNRSRCPGTFPWSDLWQFLNEQGDSMLSIQQAAEFYKEVEANQRWHCIQTDIDIAYAILNYYRTCTQVGLNGLSQYGLPLSNEETVEGYEGIVLQRFERGVICYDPNRENDSVPGLTGTCYPMHIDKGQGQDPRIIAAMKKISTVSTTPDVKTVPTTKTTGKTKAGNK